VSRKIKAKDQTVNTKGVMEIHSTLSAKQIVENLLAQNVGSLNAKISSIALTAIYRPLL
jgi:hypothetical protein